MITYVCGNCGWEGGTKAVKMERFEDGTIEIGCPECDYTMAFFNENDVPECPRALTPDLLFTENELNYLDHIICKQMRKLDSAYEQLDGVLSKFEIYRELIKERETANECNKG